MKSKFLRVWKKVSTLRREIAERRRESALGGVVAANEVVDRVRVPQAFLNLSIVHEIPLLYSDRRSSASFPQLLRPPTRLDAP